VKDAAGFFRLVVARHERWIDIQPDLGTPRFHRSRILNCKPTV
jgi:hypothetical protein